MLFSVVFSSPFFVFDATSLAHPCVSARSRFRGDREPDFTSALLIIVLIALVLVVVVVVLLLHGGGGSGGDGGGLVRLDDLGL